MLTATYTSTLTGAPSFLSFALVRVEGLLVFLAIRILSDLTFWGNNTIDYRFSCIFNISLSTEYTPFLLTVHSYLNKLSHNTSLKQLSLISDHIAQNSGHFSCILYDFQQHGTPASVHPFLKHRLPWTPLCPCWLCCICPHFRLSLLHPTLNNRQFQEEFLGCLLLSLCTLSHSNCMYLQDFNYHTCQITHYILSLTFPLTLNAQTHLTPLLECQKDVSELTCSNQTHSSPKLDLFPVFLFSVNDILSISTILSQPKLPLSLTCTSGL